MGVEEEKGGKGEGVMRGRGKGGWIGRGGVRVGHVGIYVLYVKIGYKLTQRVH